MKIITAFLVVVMMMGGVAFSAVLLQEDFTTSDSGILPASLLAEWDGGTDVIVIDLATAGIGDHTGGDGYVLRLADLGDGYWNFCFPASDANDSTTNSVVECWAYFDFEGISFERDYGLFIRSADDPAVAGRNVYSQQAGYWFLVSVNSDWGVYEPPDGVAFMLKRTDSTWARVGTEGTTVYSTGWHKLKLSAQGNELQGYVDDNLEVIGGDADYATGFAGMAYYNHPDNGRDEFGSFDNFLWETLPPLPPPTAVNPQLWPLY